MLVIYTCQWLYQFGCLSISLIIILCKLSFFVIFNVFVAKSLSPDTNGEVLLI